MSTPTYDINNWLRRSVRPCNDLGYHIEIGRYGSGYASVSRRPGKGDWKLIRTSSSLTALIERHWPFEFVDPFGGLDVTNNFSDLALMA